jgi:hypothetical protein
MWSYQKEAIFKYQWHIQPTFISKERSK